MRSNSRNRRRFLCKRLFYHWRLLPYEYRFRETSQMMHSIDAISVEKNSLRPRWNEVCLEPQSIIGRKNIQAPIRLYKRTISSALHAITLIASSRKLNWHRRKMIMTKTNRKKRKIFTSRISNFHELIGAYGTAVLQNSRVDTHNFFFLCKQRSVCCHFI